MGSARRAALTGCVIGALVVFAGCSSGGSSTTPTTRPSTPTPTAATVKGVQVNLMLTGDRTATLTGTQGSCVIPAFGAPSYEFKGGDYPNLGPAGSLKVIGPVIVKGVVGVPASTQITIGDVGLVSQLNGAGITLSKNGRVVTLDAELTGGPGGAEDINLNSPDNSLHAHIAGTIRCT